LFDTLDEDDEIKQQAEEQKIIREEEERKRLQEEEAYRVKQHFLKACRTLSHNN
jgi:hypothetical protein